MKAVIYPWGRNDAIIQLVQDFPQLDWAVAGSHEEFVREIAGASVLVTSNRVITPAWGAALRTAPHQIGWIYFSSAGIERGLAVGIPQGVRVTNSTGVKATMVAEHAMALFLAFARRLPEAAIDQRAHRYEREEVNARMGTLEGATVCVIGRGAIGRALVRKLRAFDSRVIAVSRSIDEADDLDAVFPRERIRDALASADAVAICTSGDEGSHHMIGAAELAAMKPTAFIINVARGSIVDEAALVLALQRSQIAGAGLDAQEIEPVPDDSPLWDMPNVIITPHIAGGGSTGYAQQKKLFAQNLDRFRNGGPLINECKIPAKA